MHLAADIVGALVGTHPASVPGFQSKSLTAAAGNVSENENMGTATALLFMGANTWVEPARETGSA